MFAGCAGITPYDPPDHGEPPPSRGLFSGADGEFVIYRKAEEPKTGSEAGKRSDETADGEQQKMSSDEKNAEIKNGDQQQFDGE
jgi:hypothetical protein